MPTATSAGHMVGLMTGAAACLGVWLGDELGLYRALAGNGPTSADQLAEAAGCDPRLVREWLDGQTAAGLVASRSESDTYELPDVHAAVSTRDECPAFLARSMKLTGAVFVEFLRGSGGHSCRADEPEAVRNAYAPTTPSGRTSQWVHG